MKHTTIVVAFSLVVGTLGGCKVNPFDPLESTSVAPAPSAPIVPAPKFEDMPVIAGTEARLLAEFEGHIKILDTYDDKIVVLENVTNATTWTTEKRRVWWISTESHLKELVAEYAPTADAIAAATDAVQMTVVWEEQDGELRRVSVKDAEKKEGSLPSLPHLQRNVWRYVDAAGNVIVGIQSPPGGGGGVSKFSLWENDWGTHGLQFSITLEDHLKGNWWSAMGVGGQTSVNLSLTSQLGVVILERRGSITYGGGTDEGWTRNVVDLASGNVTILPAELGSDKARGNNYGPPYKVSELRRWWVDRTNGMIYWQRNDDPNHLFKVEIGNPTAVTTIPLPQPLFLEGGSLEEGFWGNETITVAPWGLTSDPDKDRFFDPMDGAVRPLNIDVAEGFSGPYGIWRNPEWKKLGLIKFRP